MPHRLTEPRGHLARRRIHRAYRQQRDLIIEINELLDDHTCLVHPGTAHRVIPRLVEVLRPVEHTLPLARRTHHWLHHAREAHRVHGVVELVTCRCKRIATRRQAKIFPRQPTNFLTIHRHTRGLRRGNDRVVRLQIAQRVRRDRLDLRHDKIRANIVDKVFNGIRVRHVDNVMELRHVMSRRTVIPIDRVNFHPQTLESYCDLFA